MLTWTPLFCLPEACLYAKLVDLIDRLNLEGKLKRNFDYQKVSSEYKCIDGVHRDGSLKAVITDNLPLYIEKDPFLTKIIITFYSRW